MDFGLGLPSSAFGKDELRRVSEFEIHASSVSVMNDPPERRWPDYGG